MNVRFHPDEPFNTEQPTGSGASRLSPLVSLVLLVIVATGTALALTHLAWPALPHVLAPGSVSSVEEFVTAALLASGAVAASWYAITSSFALLIAIVRTIGGEVRVLDLALRRLAPRTVRRLLVAATRATAGLGVVASTAGWSIPPADVSAHTAPSTTLATVIDARTTLPISSPTSGVVEGTDVEGRPPEDHLLAPLTRGPLTPTPASTALDPSDRSGTPRPLIRVSHAPPERGTRAVAGSPYEVQPGDSLWSIARHHLAEHDATDVPDHRIAESWPQWYSANSDVIGPDPHLIHPGMQLQHPTEVQP